MSHTAFITRFGGRVGHSGARISVCKGMDVCMISACSSHVLAAIL